MAERPLYPVPRRWVSPVGPPRLEREDPAVIARRFNGTDDELVCSLGSCNLIVTYTLATLCRKREDGIQAEFFSNHASSGFAQVGIAVDTSNRLVSRTRTSTTTIAAADGWVLLVVTKAAGLVLPRGHIYKNGAWTHENLSGTSGNVNTQAGGNIRFGTTSAAIWSNVDIATAAEWHQEMSDTQVEELIANRRTQDWVNSSVARPAGLWEFNQASVGTPVTDSMGNGADQASIVDTEVITTGPLNWTYGVTATADLPYLLQRPVLAVA